MGISLSGVAAIAARDGNDRVAEQANLQSQTRKKKALKEEKLEGVRKVLAQSGVLPSSSIVVGGATYPVAASVQPTPLTVTPVSFLVHAQVNIDAAEMVNGKKDAIDLVSKSLKDAGQTIGSDQGRAIFDGYLAASEATASISGAAATVSVNQVSGFRVGKIVDIYQVDASTVVGSGVVSSITRDGDGTGSIALTLLKDGLGGTGAALTGSITGGFGFWLQGFLTPSAGFRFTSLADACGSADLYGTTVSASDWSGTDTNLADEISLAALRDLADSIASRSGNDPDVYFMGRLVFQEWEETQAGNRRYMEGDVLDPLGKNALMPTFRDKPIVVDDNCPDKQVFACNSDAYLLGIKRENSTLSNSGAAEVSQTKFEYLIKVLGMMNGIVDHRNGVGRLKNITIV